MKERTRGNYLKLIRGASVINLPDPDYGSCNTTIATSVNEARNSKGTFVGSPVGKDKVKIEPTWSVLTPAETIELLQYFDRERGGKFVNTFRVLDIRTNEWADFKMYVSDRSATPTQVSYPNGANYFIDIKLSLVQV